MITLYRAAASPAILSSLARKGGVCFARRRQSAECYLRTSHLGGAHLWAYEIEAEILDLTDGLGALADYLAGEAPAILGDLSPEDAAEEWQADGCYSVYEAIEHIPGVVEALAGRWIRYEEPDVAADGGPLSTTCDTYRFFGGACLLGRPVH